MGEKSLEERREWSSITGHISQWRGCEDRPDRPTSQGSSEQQHLILCLFSYFFVPVTTLLHFPMSSRIDWSLGLVLLVCNDGIILCNQIHVT